MVLGRREAVLEVVILNMMVRKHSHRAKMSEQRPAGGEEGTIRKPGRRAF